MCLGAIVWAVVIASGAEAAAVFHVSRRGSDADPGTQAKPFATIAQAQKAVRKRIAAGLKDNVTVMIGAGVYEPAAPLKFGPTDSGTKTCAVTYRAAGEGKVIVSGGRQIVGWKRSGGKLWTATVADVKAGKWHFRQLFVGGRRATRARTPNAGEKASHLKLTSATQAKDLKTWQLGLPAKDISNWKNISDVEIVIHGNWAINRKRLQAVDAKTGTITLAPPHAKPIPWNRPSKGRYCYLENAIEMLDKPGEWYLDRKTGVLTYLPLEGQDMTKAHVVAPILKRLVEIVGTDGKPIRNLHFRGISFEHTSWPLPAGGYHGIQACHFSTTGKNPTGRRWWGIEPAIFCEFVDSVSFTDGEVAHTGGSGIYFSNGSTNCEIIGNHIHNVAANGVMLAGANDEKLVPKGNRICNNYVHHTGQEYFGACGIWAGYVQGTTIAHNLVHDTPYTGVSVGWQWNPKPTACKKNLIEANHIYDVMKTLADGGCIYTLGYQPGTVLRGNLLHDVHRSAHTHGGAPNNGIFVDEGSKGFLFERNVIYNTHGRPVRFNQCRREWHTWKNNVMGDAAPAPGKVGKALRCNGSNAFIEAPHSAGLDAEQFTIEAWIYLDALPGGTDSRRWIVNKNANEWIEGHYGLIVHGDRPGAYLNIGGGRENHYSAVSKDAKITVKRWHHLAMTYDGASLRVFLDGQPTASTKIGKNRKSGRSTVAIGRRQDGYNYFKGAIDEVRIYSLALSADAIKAHHNKPVAIGDPGKVKGLAGYWSFDKTGAADQAAAETTAKAGLEPKYRNRLVGRGTREP
jgi:hypothetical protein